MNAERKFLLPVLFLRWSFTLSTLSVYSICSPIYPTLQTLIRQSGFFGYSLYILLFIIATLFLLPEAYW